MIKSLDRTLGKLAFTLWDTKEGGERLKEAARLQRLEYASKPELDAWQEQRLTSLVPHAARTSPWYQRVIAQAGLDLEQPVTPEALSRLPVTTKADIRNHTNEFISSDYQKIQLNRAKTGGSTGVSLNLYFDERCQQWRNAAQMYADGFAGWQLGSRIAAIWGNPPQAKTLKQKLRRYLLERMIYLDTMDLNANSMGEFVEHWRSFSPDVVFGHAHSIYLFARYLCEQGIEDLRPKGVVATSMMLLDRERAIIEQAFGVPVTNRYGCEEVGLIGVECEQHQGMHINSPHLVLECLDGQDQPVAPGEPGKLVLTDLNNYAMPLIRYRVEDVGVISDRTCPCGRSLPLLERLEGRVADFLKKPDGGQVAGVSLVERTLTKIPGVEQMQLVQENLNSLTINRVKGQDYTDSTDEALLQEFAEVFGPQVSLTINDVERIPQEASGKYRFSICKVM